MKDLAELEADQLGETRASRRLIRVGWAAIAAFVGILVVWGLTAPLDAAAVSSGYVVVAGDRKTVQHQDGGIVAAIHVTEGAEVSRGDVLVSLEPTDRAVNATVLASRLIGLRALEARLIAERDGLDVIPEAAWPFEATSREVDEISAARARQRAEFEARAANRRSRDEVLSEREAQTSSQIEGLTAELDAARRRRALVSDQLAGTRQLYDQGLTPVTTVRGLEASIADLDGETGRLTAQIAAAESSIGEIQLQRLQLTQEHLEDVASELRRVQGDIFEVEPQLREARAALERTEIRATATGFVVGLRVTTVGGVVGPGETLMEIVPTDQSLVIFAPINPRDVDDIAVGMPAEVRLDVGSRRRMPIVNGEVRMVGADRLINEMSGAPYFRADVIVSKAELERVSAFVGETVAIRPGIPAEVVIPLRERSAADYLLEPLLATFWRSFREH